MHLGLQRNAETRVYGFDDRHGQTHHIFGSGVITIHDHESLFLIDRSPTLLLAFPARLLDQPSRRYLALARGARRGETWQRGVCLLKFGEVFCA